MHVTQVLMKVYICCGKSECLRCSADGELLDSELYKVKFKEFSNLHVLKSELRRRSGFVTSLVGCNSSEFRQSLKCQHCYIHDF